MLAMAGCDPCSPTRGNVETGRDVEAFLSVKHLIAFENTLLICTVMLCLKSTYRVLT